MSNEKTIRNAFMWNQYANKGSGVIIQFKLNHDKSYHFLLGKMQYGFKNLEPINKLKELAQDFYNANNGFFYDKFPLRIIELLAFHKFKRYEEENEVRLFFNEEKLEHENHNHEAIYKDINSANEVRYFFRTFLTERKSILQNEIKDDNIIKEYFQYYPTIEIEKVILGYNLSGINLVEIQELLKELKIEFQYSFECNHFNNELDLIKLKNF